MRKVKKTIRIGVCGIHTGAGATHVSHMLALYLAGCRRKKTVVLEGDGKASFRQLEKYLFGRCGEESFRMRRCIYRCDAAEEGTDAADYIVYDAGSGVAAGMTCCFPAISISRSAAEGYFTAGSGRIFWGQRR